jgi:DNA modification methylase
MEPAKVDITNDVIMDVKNVDGLEYWRLSQRSIDLILTDPPYIISRVRVFILFQ